MKMKRKILLILVTVIMLLIMLFMLFLALKFLKYRLGFAFSDIITENNIEYQTNPIFKTARVTEITLALMEDKTTYEIVIPECIGYGNRVDGFGYVTKAGATFFSFNIENMEEITNSDEYLEEVFLPQVTCNYYVTVKIGENIKIANILLDEQYKVYQDSITGEYICVNIEYQVSPKNKYYYSQDGILYEK